MGAKRNAKGTLAGQERGTQTQRKAPEVRNL